jgi:uncharacterized protein YbjT (DUF2867 family)
MDHLELRSSTKRALVFGASGLIGSSVVEMLLDHPAYESISAFYRSPLAEAKTKIITHIVDFEQMEDWRDLITGDDLFICLGTTLNKAGSKKNFYHAEYDYINDITQLAENNGVKQVFLVSAMGADSTSYFFYNQVKGLIENSLKIKNFWSIHIFKPSVLLGNREEVRPMEALAAGAGLALKVLGPKLFSKITPIEGETVARCMVKSAQEMRSGVFFYPSNLIAKLGKKQK